jgi:hypothetical protein
MNAVSRRSTKVLAPFLVLAAAALAGCATPGGTAYSVAPARTVAVESPDPGDHTVCFGGQASRFPERQALGRVCRETLSFHSIY